jgi:AcrR family transcriptional regulator
LDPAPLKSRRKPSNRYHHGDLRRALVDVSVELVEADGAAALSLREVARRLGVSHAAPGHHFADRSALLAAVAARGFEELADAMQRASESAGCGADRLNATGVGYVEFAARHPLLFRAMFGAEIAGVTGDAELARATARAFDVLVSAVREALGASADPARVRVTITAAWSLVHGLATLFIDDKLGVGRTPADAKSLAREVTALVARSLDVG